MTLLKTTMWATAAALALAVSEFSAAEMVPVSWDAQGNFAQEVRIAPGKFVEACEKLPQGAKVRWQFEAKAPLDFNIHYHEGKEVRFPARQDGATAAEGVLEAKVAHDYCWMWSNKGRGESTLKLHLKRG